MRVSQAEQVAVADAGGALAGVVIPEVKALVVEPAYRRQGIGRAPRRGGGRDRARARPPEPAPGPASPRTPPVTPSSRPPASRSTRRCGTWTSIRTSRSRRPSGPRARGRGRSIAIGTSGRGSSCSTRRSRTTRRRCSSTPTGWRRTRARRRSADEDLLLLESAFGRAPRVLRHGAQARPGRRRRAAGRGLDHRRAAGGRRVAATGASCSAGASATCGRWARRPSRCPSTAATRARSACTRPRGSTAPRPGSAGPAPREPARGRRRAPAVGGGRRGARHRVLRDLLRVVRRVALDGRLLALRVRPADPRDRRVARVADASAR